MRKIPADKLGCSGVIILGRVSSGDQVKNLGRQIHDGIEYMDIVESASSDVVADHSGMYSMIERVPNDTLVVCRDWTRLSRDGTIYKDMVAKLRAKGCKLHYTHGKTASNIDRCSVYKLDEERNNRKRIDDKPILKDLNKAIDRYTLAKKHNVSVNYIVKLAKRHNITLKTKVDIKKANMRTYILKYYNRTNVYPTYNKLIYKFDLSRDVIASVMRDIKRIKNKQHTVINTDSPKFDPNYGKTPKQVYVETVSKRLTGIDAVIRHKMDPESDTVTIVMGGRDDKGRVDTRAIEDAVTDDLAGEVIYVDTDKTKDMLSAVRKIITKDPTKKYTINRLTDIVTDKTDDRIHGLMHEFNIDTVNGGSVTDQLKQYAGYITPIDICMDTRVVSTESCVGVRQKVKIGIIITSGVRNDGELYCRDKAKSDRLYKYGVNNIVVCYSGSEAADLINNNDKVVYVLTSDYHIKQYKVTNDYINIDGRLTVNRY